MKNWKFLMAFVLIAITFFACRKDLEADLLDTDPNVEFRNDSDSTSVDSTNAAAWKSPNDAQFMMVYQDFMSKTSDMDIWWFYHHNGFFNWSEAQIIKSSDQGDFLLSVPTMQDDSITSVMHVWKDDSLFYYWHLTVDDLNKPVDSLIARYGIEKTSLALSSYAQHGYHLEYNNDYFFGVLQKLFSPALQQNVFPEGGVIPRGWCLIRGTIREPGINYSKLARKLREDGTITYHSTTGVWVIKDNPQIRATTPEGVVRLAIENGYFDNRPDVRSAIIQGYFDAGSHEYVYYFWAWCPDEYNQVTDGNFSTNTGGVAPPGSSGNTTPPDSPTQEEREEANWNDFNQKFNDPFSRTEFELEFERLFGHLDITFEEFIRMGGLSAFDITYSDAGGDDTLIDGVKLNEEKLGQVVLNYIAANGGFSMREEPGLTAAEKALILLHPMCALLIRNNVEDAFTMTAQLFPSGTHTNDCADAFRHAFFNALNTQSCGSLLAEAFGNAHESEVPLSQINAKNMDLQNNTVGRLFAITNPSATPNELAALICNTLSLGQMTMLLEPSDVSSPLVPSTGCSCS